MPDEELAAAVAELDAERSPTVRLGFPDLVARRFGVPAEAVAYRLATLGLLAV